MSGGSLNYFCYKVEETAEEIRSRAENIEQKVFADHLILVAKALHDIEWVLSGDYGEGGEIEAIKNALGDSYKGAVLKTIQKDLTNMQQKLNELKGFDA